MYFAGDFWDETGDPFTSQFFGMGSPWTFFSIGVCIISWVMFYKYIHPRIASERRKLGFDLRPVMIIMNGLAFGTYTAGVLAGYFLTGGFQGERMTCTAYQPNATHLIDITIKYLAYLMIWTKVFDFLRPVMSILSGKENNVTIFQLLHLQTSLMLVWSAAKMNPGGVIALTALNDTLYQLAVYGYLIMLAASSEMRPKKSLRRSFLYFRQTSVAIALAHQLYYLTDPTCASVSPLLIASSVYAVLHLIFYPLDYRMRSRQRDS